MGDASAFRWDVDDLERAASDEDDAPLRAKPLVPRAPAQWHESEGTFRTTIGRFTVCVAVPPSEARWEWSAFSPSPVPRALRCKGFAEREAAQRDAETTLGTIR